MASKTKKRIYVVGHGTTVRLVRATNRYQALGHVARSIINVDVASQEQIVKFMSPPFQLAVENASDDESEELFNKE